jgi:hypothetical protein
MKKLKVFISSVQTEFARERQNLFAYLHSDPLLGLFFEPFLFENLPAADQRVDSVYRSEVARCDIYLGIFGATYGTEDAEGISATEREFDEATRQHKTRLVYVLGDLGLHRHPKMDKLIQKVGIDLVRKRFNSGDDLNSGVYASLVSYLLEKEIIRTGPFDATSNQSATLEDLDQDKIREFVYIARAKRGFPLPVEASPETILTHLNLLNNGRVSNAAILLFGKQPQRFFISSEVKCAHFHGFDVIKPIPAHQVYKGDVFQLVNQAVDFVLSKVNVSVGTREESNQVPIQYELPRAAVSEAIVNAIAHRDYTNNGSVQVMLFKDRLEIWNPGTLPLGLSPAKLRQPHRSIPANPLLAEPMYLAGYIERMGTGTGDIIRLCNEAGLKEPEFIQEEDFKTIIWRTLKTTGEVTGELSGEPTGQVEGIDNEEVNEGSTGQATGQATGQVSEEVRRIILVTDDELRSAEIQNILQLKHREYFRDNYLLPALESGFIEMTFPDSPNHPNQRYRLTADGIALKKKLQKSKKKR